jgi:hypothetical protein
MKQARYFETSEINNPDFPHNPEHPNPNVPLSTFRYHTDCLTLEDGTDRLYWNVGIQPPTYAIWHPRTAKAKWAEYRGRNLIFPISQHCLMRWITNPKRSIPALSGKQKVVLPTDSSLQATRSLHFSCATFLTLPEWLEECRLEWEDGVLHDETRVSIRYTLQELVCNWTRRCRVTNARSVKTFYLLISQKWGRKATPERTLCRNIWLVQTEILWSDVWLITNVVISVISEMGWVTMWWWVQRWSRKARSVKTLLKWGGAASFFGLRWFCSCVAQVSNVEHCYLSKTTVRKFT